MKEDYLWNKSGEADPEVERLEAMLAPLRFHAKPLALPVQQGQRFRFPLAIAAALLLALVGGIVWIAMLRQAPRQNETVARDRSVAPAPVPTPQQAVTKTENTKQGGVSINPPSLVKQPMGTARNEFAVKRTVKLDPETRREAELAAQELVRALHFASVKFNEAQRKLQVNRPAGPAS